jgi:hypothetical protein
MGHWWNNTYGYRCWIHFPSGISPVLCCIYTHRYRTWSCNNFFNLKRIEIKSSYSAQRCNALGPRAYYVCSTMLPADVMTEVRCTAHGQGPHSEHLRQARRPQPDGSGYQGKGFGAIAIHLAHGFLKSALGIHKVKNGLVPARFLLPLPGLKLLLTARRNYHSEYHVRGMTLTPPCGYAIDARGNR